MTNIGTLVLLKIGTILVVGESSTSFKSAQNMIELSNKTSGNDAAFASGRITRTMSVSSLASTECALAAGFLLCKIKEESSHIHHTGGLIHDHHSA